MKKLSMVLPLALLLAYCSGPNNTQTTNTDTNTDAAASTTTTTSSADMATASTDVSDVNTNTTTVTTDDMNHADRPVGNVTVDHSTSVVNPIPNDPNDPMYQFWQRTNGQYWTYDYDYPGYNRATAYNSAINGDWQLVMTPELVTAWRTDDSRSLWLRDGSTYVSASETFNTRTDMSGMNTGTNTNAAMNNGTAAANTNINGAATLNGQYSSTFDPQSENNIASKSNAGTVTVNGSNSAGTISSSNGSASTAGLNNNASANANTANRMNGSTSTPVTTTSPVTSPANPGVNVSANSNTTSATNGMGTAQVNGSAAGTLNTQGSNTVGSTTTMNGSVSGTTGSATTMNDPAMSSTTSAQGTMDASSINYQAYNGNMYQMPKFNLYLDNGSFTGYTGCNGISGRVEVTGNSLHFMNTTPSTAIDCMGGFDEKALVDMLKRVDSYTYVGDELQLMQGNQVLLRFKRNSQGAAMK